MAAHERLPYGKGVFRRVFALRSSPGRVVGDMEDDFHRFHVELEHDGRHVVQIRGEAARYPWSECAGATVPLRALEGMKLSRRTSALCAQTDPRANCTHLFDLAGLAVTQAAAGIEHRRYEIAVPDHDEGRTRPTLHRNGEALLAWDVKNTRIRGPAPFEGVVMRGASFLRWAEENLDPELAEAAIALRRACFISGGRARDLDEAPSAMSYMALAGGSCHSFTPGIALRAKRNPGTSLDFTHEPEALLADLSDSSRLADRGEPAVRG